MWLGCWFCVGLLCSYHDVYGELTHRRGRVRVSENLVFVFAITSSVSLAIGCLLGWHTYLALTAQTTIEFYYNRTRRDSMRHRGEVHRNQYDLGATRNWAADSRCTHASSTPYCWIMGTGAQSMCTVSAVSTASTTAACSRACCGACAVAIAAPKLLSRSWSKRHPPST